MSIHYQVGDDDVLRDYNGKEIGKVDYFGQVKHGWQDRGYIRDDGRYIDEYKRDQGWTIRSTKSSFDAEAVGTGIGLLIFGVVALIQWLQHRKREQGASDRLPSNPLNTWAIPKPNPLPRGSISLMLSNNIPFDFVYVPEGEFLMGNEKKIERIFSPQDSETPEHHVFLPGYWISRHPVTVQQFVTFIERSGHKVDLVKRSRSGESPNWPVTNVSWPDAVAFCIWASVTTGHYIGLPTEAQWEKAARGTDGRLYPWGNSYDQTRCNGGWKGHGHPTPIGMFSPQGDSPYGCTDMAGNVEEWTSSRYGRYPFRSDDGREDPRPYGHGVREVRGGSYNKNNPASVSVTRRDGYGEIAEGCWETVGFRCVCSQ